MNKLLQHMMNAGDVDHKFLPNLQKFDIGGPSIKVKDNKGRVKEYNTGSSAYKRLYNKGIGSWQAYDNASNKWVESDASNPNAEFTSSVKTLPEVVVSGKIKKNSLGDYSSNFYKETPFETFYNNRYKELKDDFAAQPGWAQRSVGGWDRESRQQNVKNQINQEYKKKYSDYVAEKLLARSPQNNQSRDRWLSGANFSKNELGILTGSEKLPQPNLWAQGSQGIYNTADMLAFGKLPEAAVPGIAKSEVQNYNNPLLALAPLSIPAKMVQSAYKNNYTFGDALAGKPNNASITEDILTDPFTWASFGGKSALTGLGKAGSLIRPQFSKLNKFIPKLGSQTKFEAVTDGYKSGSYAADKMADAGKAPIEVVDPETGASKFIYELDVNGSLPDPPIDLNPVGMSWADDAETKAFFQKPSNYDVLKHKLNKSYTKFKNKLLPENISDYSKPLSKLSTYETWGRYIHPDIRHVATPAELRALHLEGIKYFGGKSAIQSIPNPAKHMGMFVRERLAHKLPSFTDPAVVDETTGFIKNYGPDKPHPSFNDANHVYPSLAEAYQFDNTAKELLHKPVHQWDYDISKLSANENNLIDAYAHGYNNYFNDIGRSDKYQAIKTKTGDFYKERIPQLREAILKNKFPEATVVRRGEGADFSVNLLDPVTRKPTGVVKKRSELSVGDVFKDDGFLSTSLNKDYTWGNQDFSEIIEIPGGYKQSYAYPNASSSSPYTSELEALLPPGLIRKVEEVRQLDEAGRFPNNAKFRTSLLNPYAMMLPFMGAAALSQKRNGGPIVDPRGQWAHPGKRTMVPTPTGQITMRDVPYPVYGQDETGYGQMMYPGGEYQFPGQMVDETPMMQNGGLLSRSVTCSSCGHSWQSVEGGMDPLTCHKCGGIVKMKHGGSLPVYQVKGKVMSSTDSLRHQAGKMMDYEARKGSPTGSGLPNWGYHQSQMPYNMVPQNWQQPRTKDEAVNMYMKEIAPRLGNFSSAMEKGEAGDFMYNTGRDPRVYMLDQYLKSIGQSGLPNRGSYNVDTKTPAWTPQLQQSLDSQWNQYKEAIDKLPENQRRVLLNKGRDYYYQNINKKPDGSPNDSYNATWKPRIWESVNTFSKGGQMLRRADGSYSQRGLWDNVRANKGSGKKPTKEMIEQERKIKAKNK